MLVSIPGRGADVAPAGAMTRRAVCKRSAGKQGAQGGQIGRQSGPFFTVSGAKKQKRIPFLKNKPEKLLITKNRAPKTNRNKPKNKAEKLLKTRSCGKNKAKNKPGHVVENTGSPKFAPREPERMIPSPGKSAYR
jgi:hypothetical protein